MGMGWDGLDDAMPQFQAPSDGASILSGPLNVLYRQCTVADCQRVQYCHYRNHILLTRIGKYTRKRSLANFPHPAVLTSRWLSAPLLLMQIVPGTTEQTTLDHPKP